MTGIQSATSKKRTVCRIFAVFCAVCMALLQCAVFLITSPEESYAEGGIQITGVIPGDGGSEGVSQTTTASIDGKSLRNYLKERIDINELDGFTSNYDGLSLDDIINKDSGGCYIEVKHEAEPDPTDPPEDPEEGEATDPTDPPEPSKVTERIPIEWITFHMKSGYDPIQKISIDDGTIKVGQEKKLKYGEDYKIVIDSFFKELVENNSEDFYEISADNTSPDISKDKTITIPAPDKEDIGQKITISIKSKNSSLSSSAAIKVVTKGITVSPTKLELQEKREATITVKGDNGKVLENSDLKWSSSNTKVAKVSAGTVTAVKKGTATITVKYNGAKATVSVKVTDAPKSSTYHYYTGKRPTYYSGSRYSTRSTYTSSSTSRPTTATRPPETTVQPTFQTMTVREVFLTPTNSQNPLEDDTGTVYYDENGDIIEMDDEEWDDEWDDEEEWDEEWDEEEDWDDSGVEFGPAVGSAAVAAAACGAGAVGRIRRFRIDMGDGVMNQVEKPMKASGDKPEAGGVDGEKKKRIPFHNPFKK